MCEESCCCSLYKLECIVKIRIGVGSKFNWGGGGGGGDTC